MLLKLNSARTQTSVSGGGVTHEQRRRKPPSALVQTQTPPSVSFMSNVTPAWLHLPGSTFCYLCSQQPFISSTEERNTVGGKRSDFRFIRTGDCNKKNAGCWKRRKRASSVLLSLMVIVAMQRYQFGSGYLTIPSTKTDTSSTHTQKCIELEDRFYFILC